MEHHGIQRALERHQNSINDAVYDILQEWRKSVQDPVEAVETLHEALTHQSE